MQLLIQADGSIRCLYAEKLPLQEFGALTIRRGSHVEPGPDGTWTVDLSPVNGPLLGPYALRSAALQAETDWLEAHWLQRPMID